MKIKHKEYLEQMLASKKLELREEEITHRISIAKFNTIKDLMEQQIYSIEKQLQEGIE